MAMEEEGAVSPRAEGSGEHQDRGDAIQLRAQPTRSKGGALRLLTKSGKGGAPDDARPTGVAIRGGSRVFSGEMNGVE